MKLGIDTCTWLKLFRLNTLKLDIIDELVTNYHIFITHDVLEECLHYSPENKEIFRNIEVLPRLNKQYDHYKAAGFDPADSSLLEYADQNATGEHNLEYVIVTEDPEMLGQNVYRTMRLIKLIDWLVLMGNYSLLGKRDIKEIARYLYKSRNITKRKLDKVLKE